MEKQKKAINILYPIFLFWINKKAFFSFLFLTAIPLFIASFVVWHFSSEFPFYKLVSSVFIGIAYFLMLLFIISFTVLHRVSKKVEISLSKILKLIPFLNKTTVFFSGIFAFLILLTGKLFFIVPFALLVFFPTVLFLPVYKNSLATKDLFSENKNYLTSSVGRGLIGKVIILFLLLLTAAGITNFFLEIVFSFSYQIIVYKALFTVKLLLRFFVFFILYLFINEYYTKQNFIISTKLKSAAENVLFEKNRDRRKIKQRKRSEEKEFNRFEQTNEYNRFEDTKF